MKILVAEDDATTRMIMKKLLTDWGHESILVADGEEAWNLLNEEDPPRVVILDWMIPGMDGIEICQRLDSRKNQIYTYTIFMTSRNKREDILKGFEAGADDYLIKPVDPEELKSRLNTGIRIVNYETTLRSQEFRIRLECYNALTELAEARDKETGAHLHRLSAYSQAIAHNLGMPVDFIEQIGLFAPMHDIGKVGIPDSILLAPRRLTTDEFQIMKTHATLGGQILAGKETLEMAYDIAIAHHERFDGTGYPHGLEGEEIPLAGRIVALADVYDALRSRRTYKDGWGHEHACALIIDQANKHFDPEIIEIFGHIHDVFDECFEQYKDTHSIHSIQDVSEQGA